MNNVHYFASPVDAYTYILDFIFYYTWARYFLSVEIMFFNPELYVDRNTIRWTFWHH